MRLTHHLLYNPINQYHQSHIPPTVITTQSVIRTATNKYTHTERLSTESIQQHPEQETKPTTMTMTTTATTMKRASASLSMLCLLTAPFALLSTHASVVAGFVTVSPNHQRLLSTTRTSSSSAAASPSKGVSLPMLSPPAMFIGELISTTKKGSQKRKLMDSTSIGNLRVPSVGVGTISWSSDSCECTAHAFVFRNSTVTRSVVNETMLHLNLDSTFI